jgi:hypothetical protein
MVGKPNDLDKILDYIKPSMSCFIYAGCILKLGWQLLLSDVYHINGIKQNH